MAIVTNSKENRHFVKADATRARGTRAKCLADMHMHEVI